MSKILIIDDDAAIGRLLSRQLAKAGHTVEALTSGEAGLAALTGPTTWDALVCDLGLPSMTGAQVVELVRAEERTSTLPVVVISARTSMQDHTLALEAGADVFIEKPLPMAKLIETIESLIKARRGHDGHDGHDHQDKQRGGQ